MQPVRIRSNALSECSKAKAYIEEAKGLTNRKIKNSVENRQKRVLRIIAIGTQVSLCT